jgi:hypothetical protein
MPAKSRAAAKSPRRGPRIAVRKLRDLAAIIRSKNAGPFRVTFDILFDDAASFEAARASRAITAETVAKLYGVPVSRISSIFEVAVANAIKITMIRPLPQCAIGETDVYGAQQHAPLLDIEIPVGGNYGAGG